MALYEKDADGKLVPIQGEVPEEAIRLMDSFDEEAIIHRLTTGIASDAFIYHYPIKTKFGAKEIVGVSTDGAYELASMLGNIEVLQDVRVDKESDPDYFYAMVRAKDVSRNVTLLGVARQCKFMVDEGNIPIRDRLNEHAFVASISKAQRNAILHLTPEEVIAKIINNWSQRGKSKQLRPPPLEVEAEPKPTAPPAAKAQTAVAPAATVAQTPETTMAAQVIEQQEKLKKLRMEVHNRFQTDLGIGLEKRKAMLNERFGVDSLTGLSEQQLKECKAWVDEMIDERTQAPASTPVAAPETKVTQSALGFGSADEQGRLRGTLYSMLTGSNQLNLKPEEAKKFIADRGFTSANEVPKERLLGMINEVEELIEIKQAPPPSEGEVSPDSLF